MAAGDRTPGRRRPDGTDPWDLQPGDYCKRGSAWWVCLPTDEPGAGRRLGGWTAEEHEDGTVTITPSIQEAPSGWHGYLERGEWREV